MLENVYYFQVTVHLICDYNLWVVVGNEYTVKPVIIEEDIDFPKKVMLFIIFVLNMKIL